MAQCCGSPHPFDVAHVRDRWWPRELRCLIIGESPGAPGAPYFYDPVPERDPVLVRRLMLSSLARAGLITAPTLAAFQDGGFLFDHAIRCQLPMEEIQRERRRAQRYRSIHAARAEHLREAIEAASSVWAMGLIARNAVAALYPEIPKEQRRLNPPYRISAAPKFFVTRYFSRWTSTADVDRIVLAVRGFLTG
jgi:hypothetical protein